MAVFNAGVARKYEAAVPWRLMGVVFVVSIAACYLIQDMPRNSFSRMLLYQLPYFLMQTVGVGIVWSAKSRRPLDNPFMVVLSASALQFLSKAFLFQAFGGTGATAQDYLKTNYALFSQSIGTVFAMAIALLMLVILVRDIFADVTAKSETDALSGLLNRGGFERHAEAALRDAARMGLPLTLVISDLDHFKAINDTFGHAAGDRVIEAFAGFLRSATSGHQIAGRIGGEEFAIVLPGTNLSGARLFAEGARGAFAALPIEGLPDGRRFTASFGVAELCSGEGISDLMRRADEALYDAKRSGRDCVRISAHARRDLLAAAG
ncbi:MAG TPA: GGDEF domain-containing protein [Pseudaminobacter sp.]|nr:GGDEF domain-containing protein [Pseudaminobacter sp.]